MHGLLDVIGHFRAVNFILLLWKIIPVIFPLDVKLVRVFLKNQNLIEELLDVVCEICLIQESDVIFLYGQRFVILLTISKKKICTI